MGLAASQARALLLVARKSDLEYRSQCLTQRKMVLAQQTEQLAKEYSTKISNRKLRFVYNLNGEDGRTQTEDLTYYSLGAENQKFVGTYRLVNAYGAIIVASEDEIPMTKDVQVKQYYIGKVTTKDDGSTTVNASDILTTSNPIYNTTSAKAGSAGSTALYFYGLNEKGEKAYIQVQDNEGKPIDATYYSKNSDGTLIAHKYYASIEDDKGTVDTAVEKVGLYTLSLSNAYYVTTDTTSALSDGLQYIPAGYTTAREARTQGADGYYTSDDGRRYMVCPEIANKTYFQNGLRNGAFVLQQAETIEQTGDDGLPTGISSTSWNTKPWQGIDVVQDVLYTEDDAMAQSEYEAKTAVIKAQDQMIDLEIKQIETQHKAIETEQDSVKKIIEGNIDKTFKIFA